jgi:hypothetical protein
LRPSEAQTDDELIEITVTKLLLRSYYDIVRKNIQDVVPKAIMHFLVNNSKREFHSVFIKKLYRENLFEEDAARTGRNSNEEEILQGSSKGFAASIMDIG